MKKVLFALTVLGLMAFASCTPEEIVSPEDFAIDQENVPGNDPEEDPEDDS